MKAIRILGHPITVICSFLFVLISGESFGGFYLIYVLFGLQIRALHAFVAIFAIIILSASLIGSLKNNIWLKYLLNIIGFLMMIIAFLIFFENSKGYNDSTFHQILPLISLVLFSLSGICTFYISMIELLKTIPSKNKA